MQLRRSLLADWGEAMAALVVLLTIIKYAGSVISFYFGVRKVYRIVRRKRNKKKPTA
jgi:hypothetical protein